MRPVLADTAHIAQIGLRDPKNGLWIALAEGGQAFERLDIFPVQRCQLRILFKPINRFKCIVRIRFPNVALKGFRKLVESFRLHGDACGTRMAAKLLKKAGKGLQAVIQVDIRYTSAGSDVFPAALSKEKHGTMVLFGEPSRSDADDAEVPIDPMQNDGSAGAQCFRWIAVFNFLKDALFL